MAKNFYNVRVEASSSKLLDFIWKNAGHDHIKNKCQWPYADAFHVQPERENRKVIDTVASFDRTTKTWSVHRDEPREG